MYRRAWSFASVRVRFTDSPVGPFSGPFTGNYVLRPFVLELHHLVLHVTAYRAVLRCGSQHEGRRGNKFSPTAEGGITIAVATRCQNKKIKHAAHLGVWGRGSTRSNPIRSEHTTYGPSRTPTPLRAKAIFFLLIWQEKFHNYEYSTTAGPKMNAAAMTTDNSAPMTLV